MNIVSVNQDQGIDENRQKGAAIHLRSIRKAFADLGHRVHRVDEQTPAKLLQALDCLVRQESIDLIYERYALGKSTAAAFAAEQGIPFVLEVNAPLAEEAAAWRGYTPSTQIDAADHYLFRSATAVIAVTRQTADYALRRGAEASRVRVCANGVDTGIFKPRDRAACKAALGIDPDAFVLGFHGRLRPWHAFERLVSAVVDLQTAGLPAHLLTAGEGPYEDACAGQIPSQLHTHLPWLDQHELGPVVSAYDVLPLMYDPEAPCYFSPLKLYEAMACGAIPVVPRIGDLTLFVRHQQNGIVYSGQDLARELLQLQPQAERRLQLQNAAIESASQQTWSAVALRTLQAAGLHGDREQTSAQRSL